MTVHHKMELHRRVWVNPKPTNAVKLKRCSVMRYSRPRILVFCAAQMVWYGKTEQLHPSYLGGQAEPARYQENAPLDV